MMNLKEDKYVIIPAAFLTLTMWTLMTKIYFTLRKSDSHAVSTWPRLFANVDFERWNLTYAINNSFLLISKVHPRKHTNLLDGWSIWFQNTDNAVLVVSIMAHSEKTPWGIAVNLQPDVRSGVPGTSRGIFVHNVKDIGICLPPMWIT